MKIPEEKQEIDNQGQENKTEVDELLEVGTKNIQISL